MLALWLSTLTLISDPLGQMTQAELRQIEELSFESQLKRYLVKAKQTRAAEQTDRTFSTPVLLMLSGASASLAVGLWNRESESSCRRRLRKIGFRTLGAALGSAWIYSLYRIWSQRPDDEVEWMNRSAQAFSGANRAERISKLVSLYQGAIRRDLGSDVSTSIIEVKLSEDVEIWTGLPEMAWVDGVPFVSQYAWDARHEHLRYFFWSTKK